MGAPDTTAETKPPPALAFLRNHREEIFRVVARRGADDVRVFGVTEHDDQLYLSDIAEAIARIRRSIGGDKARLFDDTDIQDATLRRLHIVADSTQGLSQEVKGRHPEIPWADIAVFRNIVVHGYLYFDLTRVRAVIERDLVPLGSAVEAEPSRTRHRASEIARDHDRGQGLGL